LAIVRGLGENQETKMAKGPVSDTLNRRDQAVEKALEEVTLKSLASDPQPKKLWVASTRSES
jgi:hypothetical protein